MDRTTIEFVYTEGLVPQDHMLRKIDAAVDFSKTYEMVEPLYCADNGRPSIDPVVLFKMVLIQHLYGLSSLRRTASEVSVNILLLFWPRKRIVCRRYRCCFVLSAYKRTQRNAGLGNRKSHYRFVCGCRLQAYIKHQKRVAQAFDNRNINCFVNRHCNAWSKITCRNVFVFSAVSFESRQKLLCVCC